MPEGNVQFREIIIERGVKSVAVYDGTRNPGSTLPTIITVRALCSGCGTQFSARKSLQNAVPGTFCLLAFGKVQMTCPKCKQQGIFDQAKYP